MNLKVMAYKRRLYYFPGLISLVGLFIFFISIKDEIKPKEYTMLDLNVPSDQKGIYMPFSSYWIEKEIKRKKQIRITLDNDRRTNQKKIEFIKYEARKLKYTHDTMTVINVTLTNEITYGEFIQLLDLCHADQHKRFVPLKSSFIIFGEPWPKKAAEATNNSYCILSNDVIIIPKPEKKITLTEKIITKLRPFVFKDNIYLITGWTLLIICFLYYRKRKQSST